MPLVTTSLRLAHVLHQLELVREQSAPTAKLIEDSLKLAKSACTQVDHCTSSLFLHALLSCSLAVLVVQL